MIESFDTVLRKSEVAWGYIAVDYREREIFDGDFTVKYSGKSYSLRVNKVGRIVSKDLLHDLHAKVGMRLTFKKQGDHLFSIDT